MRKTFAAYVSGVAGVQLLVVALLVLPVARRMPHEK